MAKKNHDKAAAPKVAADAGAPEETAGDRAKPLQGGFVLTGKNSIGGVFDRKILKGDSITPAEYEKLPERIKPYFEKAE